jgi:hypothetical protein
MVNSFFATNTPERTFSVWTGHIGIKYHRNY